MMAMETDWIFDDFDPGTQQLAGQKEFKNYKDFLTEYAEQLNGIEEALDDTLGDAWDFTLDPIALQTRPYEHATLLELIRTDHKILNKVVTVFAALCSEINEHKQKAVTKYYIPLLMYGEGGRGDSEQDGESQLMTGRMLDLLQDLTMFINRISLLVKNVVEQLAALYSTEGTLKVINASGIHLETVFEHIGDALSILINLDNIFDNAGVFGNHWERYKRVITSIKGSPQEYGVDESKLRPFERLLQSLEGILMDGRIFENCVQQIFNVDVTQNQQLHEEFLHCMRSLFVQIDSKLVESREMDTRQLIIGLCGLLVLHYQLFNVPEKKLAKQVWDLYKKIPAVHVVGDLMFFHDEFLILKLRYMQKILDKKSKNAVQPMREQWLSVSSQNLPKMAQHFYLSVSSWMIKMESDLASKGKLEVDINHRATLFVKGMLMAYNISNYVATLLNLHSILKKPMTKSGVLAVCRMAELLKSIQYTFHRRAILVAEFQSLAMNHYEILILHALENMTEQITVSQQKHYSDRALDIMAALSLMKMVINGPGTRERRLISKLAFPFASQRPLKEDEKLIALLRKLDAISELRIRVHQACDCSFLYWHKDAIVPLYFANIYNNPCEAHRLHYMFTTLSDCVPAMRWCKHLETPDVLVKIFEDDVYQHLKELILDPLTHAVEEDLRLSTHLHLKLDDRNPFKIGIRDLKLFFVVKPVRFFDRTIDMKAYTTHYLDTTFYNLTTVALHDWKTYGDMRNLAEQKYGLMMLEPHLPSATLEQGLDVLEIMRNINVFVGRFCYNLNNQIFVERTSNNKHLNTINIRHIANSIRTHGTGIMNTTVNFTYQFLRKKFYIFSQFMYDEYIKARLLKEIRFYREHQFDPEVDQKYPFARAERFNRIIRKLGMNSENMSYLDQFRILITQIGNAMGYIRMIRSGGLHCCSSAIKFVPDLEDIVSFEELCGDTELNDDTMTSAKIFDGVIGNLAKNFAEGTEYFKLLVDVFSLVFRNPKNRHLQNFYMIIPPLTLNYVEYIINAKDKMNRKNTKGAAFTDDGFAMGVAYILKLVDQYHAFDSLHWFESVKLKYQMEMRSTNQSQVKGAGDEKLHQTIQLSLQRMHTYSREFELLDYSLRSARIFFRADLTAEEEQQEPKKDESDSGKTEEQAQTGDEGGTGPPPPPPPDTSSGGVPPPPPPPPPM